jgi:8-oxo-dGTP pyrophosphatase MutT (NUDIX family)
MRRIPVPRGVGMRAAEVASGQRQAAVPRNAATVMLVRPGIEVLMLARARAMDFAPGAHVFPGGSVDPDDAEAPWDGPLPSPDLGVPPELARTLISAAVRETFEESGVLLGYDKPLSEDRLADDPLSDDRHALLAGQRSFGEIMRKNKLALTSDLLTPWGRWITPEASDRRFDTWFFAAAMPAGQVADASAESDSIAWLRPADALDAARAGQLTLLPPTAVMLAQLSGYADVGGVLGARPDIAPLMPTVAVEDDGTWLIMPDGTDYPL